MLLGRASGAIHVELRDRLTRRGFQIQLGETVELRGQVVDLSTGDAVAGAAVHLDGTDLQGVTDQDGRFAFETVVPGQYRLEVHHKAYGDYAQDLAATGEEVLDLRVRLPRRK